MSNHLRRSPEVNPTTKILTAVSIGLLALGLTGCNKPAKAKEMPTTTYTVQPGDTMSGIVAKECQVGYPEINEGVIAIQLANKRSSTGVSAGETLEIPGNMCDELRDKK